jgi:hypothetical protein
MWFTGKMAADDEMCHVGLARRRTELLASYLSAVTQSDAVRRLLIGRHHCRDHEKKKEHYKTKTLSGVKSRQQHQRNASQKMAAGRA